MDDPIARRRASSAPMDEKRLVFATPQNDQQMASARDRRAHMVANKLKKVSFIGFATPARAVPSSSRSWLKAGKEVIEIASQRLTPADTSVTGQALNC